MPCRYSRKIGLPDLLPFSLSDFITLYDTGMKPPMPEYTDVMAK